MSNKAPHPKQQLRKCQVPLRFTERHAQNFTIFRCLYTKRHQPNDFVIGCEESQLFYRAPGTTSRQDLDGKSYIQEGSPNTFPLPCNSLSIQFFICSNTRHCSAAPLWMPHPTQAWWAFTTLESCLIFPLKPITQEGQLSPLHACCCCPRSIIGLVPVPPVSFQTSKLVWFSYLCMWASKQEWELMGLGLQATVHKPWSDCCLEVSVTTATSQIPENMEASSEGEGKKKKNR